VPFSLPPTLTLSLNVHVHGLQNIEDGSDSWFLTSNSDLGEQFEYLEGNYETSWIPPATYSSYLKVILVS